MDRAIEELSPEAQLVYKKVVSDLSKAFAPAARRVADMDAILFARHADIYADIVRNKTGRKYTALDYMRERYGFGATGKRGKGKLYQNQGEIAEARLYADEKAWGKSVDGFLTGTLRSDMKPVIMNAPLVLSLVGARADVPLRIRQRTMRKILQDMESSNRHGHAEEISADVFKKLPSLMSDPMMVLRSRSNRNGEYDLKRDGYTFIVEAMDNDGKRIIVPITFKIEGNEYYLASFYGKKDIGLWLKKHVEQGDVLYVNTQKNPQLWEGT